MTERRVLPMRRACETFELAFGGARNAHVVTLGFYENGDFGELFINSGKSGEMLEILMKECAKIISVSRGYGTPIEAIQNVVTRDAEGKPESIIGAIVDCIADHQP